MSASRVTTVSGPRVRERAGRAFACALAIASVVVLAGCTQDAPLSSPTPSATASASAAPVPSPTPTVLSEATDADEALPFFTAAVMGVWGTDAQYEGRAYIDALTAAGFDKAAMQVTDDLTAVVGLQADSIQFSVRWADECLVGQVGPAIGDPVVVVVPGLEAGGCLIGNTRDIDW